VEEYIIAGQTTDDSIIGRMRFACWITKATDITLEICNTYCFSISNMVSWMHLHVTFMLIITWLVPPPSQSLQRGGRATLWNESDCSACYL